MGFIRPAKGGVPAGPGGVFRGTALLTEEAVVGAALAEGVALGVCGGSGWAPPHAAIALPRTKDTARKLEPFLTKTTSKLSAGRKKRQLVVRLPKPSRQRAYATPEDFERQVFVQKKQIVERVLGDHQESAALVGAGIGRAG